MPLNRLLRTSIVLFALVWVSGASGQEKAPTGSDVMDIGLVIDESGSLRYNDPARMRIDAALLLMDLLNDSDNIALVGFGEGARQVNSLLEIALNRTNLVANVRAIGEKGKFSMVKEGLSEMLNTYKQRTVVHPSAVILLTDGEFEPDDFPAGTQLDSYFSELNRLAQEFASLGIPIYAVAFTKAANLSVLSDVARQSGGASYQALQAKDIQKVYTDIFQNFKPFVATNIGPEQLGAQEKSYKINVPFGIGQLIVIIYKESSKDPQPEISIVDPSGQLIEGERNSAPSYCLVKVKDPVQGEWTARIKGRGRVEISFLEKIGVDTVLIRPGPNELSRSLNDNLEIRVQLIPKASNLSPKDYAVEAEILRPDGRTDIISMNDAGEAPDEASDDWIFSGRYQNLDKPGKYSLAVKTSLRENTEMKRILKADIAVKVVPDFDIKMESTLNVGVPVRITAKPAVGEEVGRLRKIEAVRFFKGKPDKPVELLDDGRTEKDGDELAGDRIFSAILEGFKSPGVYEIAIKALFEIKSGEVYSKEKSHRVFKVVETGEVAIPVEKEGESTGQAVIKYYGTQKASLALIKADGLADNLSLKLVGPSPALEPGKENELGISLAATGIIPTGKYPGTLIIKVVSPEIQGDINSFTLPCSINVPSWAVKHRSVMLIAIAALAVLLGLLVFRFATRPRFAKNEFLILLDERNEEITQYSLKKKQKFYKSSLVISKDIRIPGIPRNSFKISTTRDSRTTIKALRKRVHFTEEVTLSLKKSRTLGSRDEFDIDGTKLRYEREL